jgi:hypothetical protein
VEDYIFATFQKVQTCQIHNLVLVHTGLPGKGKGVECPFPWQYRIPQTVLHTALLANAQLFPKQIIDNVLGSCPLFGQGDLILKNHRHALELQGLHEFNNLIFLVHFFTPHPKSYAQELCTGKLHEDRYQPNYQT